MTYEDYLRRAGVLGRGFGYREIVNGNRKHMLPPRGLWPNIVETLEIAIELRRLAIEAGACTGLRIAAAYRPEGGSKKSRHKTNRALDLDRIGGDGRTYFEVATRLWFGMPSSARMGLGLYTGSTHETGGIRVHIDAGSTRRSWQGIGSGFGKPWTVGGIKVGLVQHLANEMGL